MLKAGGCAKGHRGTQGNSGKRRYWGAPSGGAVKTGDTGETGDRRDRGHRGHRKY